MTSRPTVRQAAHLFTALSLCLLATACSQVPVMRGEIVGLRDVIEQWITAQPDCLRAPALGRIAQGACR